MITQKLYSPVYCFLAEQDDEGEFDYGSDFGIPNITQQDAAYYCDSVHEAILKERMRDEGERGLMTYYHYHGTFDSGVNDKVRSLFVDVEEHDGRLWGVATIEVTGELESDELDELRDYISGQYSDGFGEGFEQREIKTGNGDLYVSLWSSDKSFRIMTEDEFRQQLSPEQTAGSDQLRKPRCPMIGTDGNVFNLIGLVSSTLKENGMADAAAEMRERVMACGSYNEALAVMTEYVEPVSDGGARHDPSFDMSM